MYQRIELCCECGKRAAGLRELGLTMDRQLVVHWRCAGCKRHVYVMKPLADYWRECPSERLSGPTKRTVTSSAWEASDALFLRQVGIRPDEPVMNS
jgi:hypothetical protein